MNPDNFHKPDGSANGPWAMRLQIIGGSYLLCLPKTWIRKNVPAGQNLMLIQDHSGEALIIRPMPVPKLNDPSKNRPK